MFALTDGTGIAGEPAVSRFASWSFGSIRSFARACASGTERLHCPFALIASDGEAYLRGCVWLPNPDDFAVATTYVLLRYVFQVFDAVPLLLVNGPKGTGKTELGQAIADFSCTVSSSDSPRRRGSSALCTRPGTWWCSTTLSG